jgi:hypothetical protein
MVTPSDIAVVPVAIGDTPIQVAFQVAGSAEPNWLILMSLIYLGLGLFAFAAAIVGGCQWQGYGDLRRAWGSSHQAYGVSFAVLLALIGLALNGLAQFYTLSFGHEVVLLFLALVPLFVAFVFAGDYLGEPRESVG